MIASVRGRLTLAVALISGGLVVGLALTAPKTVHNSLVGDRLDAEVDGERAALTEPAIINEVYGRPIDAAGFESVYGPQIAQMTSELAESDALDRLRTFDDDDRIFVSLGSDVVATVERDGAVHVEQVGSEGRPGPVVSVRHLDELSDRFGQPSMFDNPFDLFIIDGPLSIEEFLAEIDAEFGSDFGERFDRDVFEQLPRFDLDDGLVPDGVLELGS